MRFRGSDREETEYKRKGVSGDVHDSRVNRESEVRTAATRSSSRCWRNKSSRRSRLADDLFRLKALISFL